MPMYWSSDDEPRPDRPAARHLFGLLRLLALAALLAWFMATIGR